MVALARIAVGTVYLPLVEIASNVTRTEPFFAPRRQKIILLYSSVSKSDHATLENRGFSRAVLPDDRDRAALAKRIRRRS